MTGSGGLPCEKVGMLVGNFCFDLLVQAFSTPKNGKKRTFRNKGFMLSREFTSLAPELLSGILVFNTKVLLSDV